MVAQDFPYFLLLVSKIFSINEKKEKPLYGRKTWKIKGEFKAKTGEELARNPN